MFNENDTFAVGMVNCFFCGEPKGIIMNTRLTKKNAKQIKEIHNHAIDYEPCDKCKALMKQGIMFVSVRDGESGNNPYRTGKMCVIKEEAVKNMVSPELYEHLKRVRFGFIEDSIWEQLGLPVEEMATV